jgi:CelD/BcsL family acetyltransferase involved in cellulose biosynthesis
VLASSGLTWSRIGTGAVTAADAPSSAYLTTCARELARHVGPMAKIFVEEGVRKVCPDVPFSLAASRALADELSARIEDDGDRQVFLAALQKSGDK